MNQPKWYEMPMRIGAFQWSQGKDMFKVPDVLAEGGFNVEQLLHLVAKNESLGLTVFDPEIDGDNLLKYVEKSHKLGIKIILYYNAHMIEKKFIEKNPDWAQTSKSGEQLKAYEKFIFTCPNSPWRDYLMKSIDTVLDYGIDGIFLDGPVFMSDGCYCKECRKLFEEQFNHSMDNASDREMRDFKTKHIARILKDIKEIINKKSPETILYANSNGLYANVTGCDIDAIYPYIDLIGTEGGFIFYSDPNDVSIWQEARNSKYIDSKSKGKPTVIFCAGNHYPWARYMHTPEESRLLFASAVANGANVWYGIHGPMELLNSPGGKAAYEFNRFLKKNEEYYKKTERIADVALVWSKDTLHEFPGDIQKRDFTNAKKQTQTYEYGDYLKEFHGMYDILTRNHCEFAIIGEKEIAEDDLSKFKMIILPNVSCLSKKNAERLKEYVKNGGHLFSTLASSFYDEIGNDIGNPSLSDVFGLKCKGQAYHHNPGCNYIEYTDNEWVLSGMNDKLSAGWNISLRNEYKNDAEILAYMYEPLNGVYDVFPTKKYPSVILNHYGKGTSVYVSGGVGQTYTSYCPFDVKKFVDNILKHFVDPAVRVENVFESVDVELRQQKESGRKLLHFVNYTGCMKRPIENIRQCSGAKVYLKTDSSVKKVFSVYNPANVDFKQFSDHIEFTVPTFAEYELVVIES